MDGKNCYLNTDLDLMSSDELTELAAAFGTGGVSPLYVTHGEDELWYAAGAMLSRPFHEGISPPRPDVAAKAC